MTAHGLEEVMSKRTIGPVVVPAERRCIACETASSSNTKYCGECGHQLAGTAASAVRPLGLPMARRTSRCERKRVTVLFTDVSGFTAMSERLDNEYLFAMMEQAFEVILDQ